MKRRSLLALAGLGLLTPAALAACSSTTDSKDSSGSGSALPDALRVHTPTTLAYAAPMALFGTYGNLDGIVGDVQKDNWNTTDVLKSLLINGETDLAATPSYVAANLFNKGVALRLIAMQVWGMLYVIGPSGSSEQGLEALRGKTVGVPRPNDMPGLVFRYLLEQNGWDIDSDLSKTPYNEGQDALNALLTGEVLSLERTLNLQDLWAEVTGGEARFPMAGLVMPQTLTDDHPELVGAVLNELEAAVADVNGQTDETVQTISDTTGVPVPVVKETIPRLQLKIVAATDARGELEDFYTRMSTLDPDIIGGSLPAEDFYVADPR